MAKLNGVKTIDMVNGEITKVTYDGAEYVLTKGGEASLGDLVLVTDDTWVNSTKGAFYKTEKLRDGKYPRLIDDIGELDSNFYDGSYEVFHKISAQTPTPTIEARVEALEADVATIKGAQVSESTRLTVGDYAKVIAKECSHGSKIGDVVKIVYDANDRQPYRCEDAVSGKSVGWFHVRELERADKPPVIPQVGDVVTFEGFGGEYRKVDREAQAGDFVVFHNRKNNESWITLGKPYKALTGSTYKLEFEDNVGDHLFIYVNDRRNTTNTDVFEKVEAQYVPQKGDIVVVTAKGTHDYSEGDVVKIDAELSVANGGQASTVRLYGETPDCCYVFANEVRKATPAEVVAYEKAVHKASFSVGDYVKLVNSKRENNGAICVISDIDGLSLPVKLRHISGKFPETTSYATYDQIVKATEQEVADASKPKLKAGDFVKFTKEGDYCEDDITIGKAYEIVDVSELGFYDDDEDFRTAPLEYTECYEILSADEAKWAQIGRKVGEVKVGDLVVITEYCCGAKVGEIVKVSKTREQPHGNTRIYYDYHDTTQGFTAHHGAYEIIAPVESTLK